MSHTVPLILRALEPNDLDFVYSCENDACIQAEGSQLAPLSRHALRQLIDTAFLPITETGQLRLILAIESTGEPIGIADLYDISLVHRHASVGLAIHPATQRGRGHGHTAIALIEHYAYCRLNLCQLYTEIRASNLASQKLFADCGYLSVGTKRAWFRTEADIWEDVHCLQHTLTRTA